MKGNGFPTIYKKFGFSKLFLFANLFLVSKKHEGGAKMRPKKALLVIEVAFFALCVELALFLPFRYQSPAIKALCAWMLISEVIYFTLRVLGIGPELGRLGFGLVEVTSSLKALWKWILGGVVTLLIVGVMAGSLKYESCGTTLYEYARSSLVQQLALQIYTLRRLLLVVSPRWSVFLASTLFAVGHVPNLPFMMLTFFCGLLVTRNFVRYRCFYTVWATHLILGLVAAVCLQPFLNERKIGMRYLCHYQLAKEERLLLWLKK